MVAASETMYDVVISGAGPVGAALAIALATLPQNLSTQGVPAAPLRIAVLEAQALVPGAASAQELYQPAFDNRCIALAEGSCRFLRQLGVWGEIATQAEAIRQVHVSEQGRFGVTRFSAEQEGVAALGHEVEMAWVQAVLSHRLRQLSSGSLSSGQSSSAQPASLYLQGDTRITGVQTLPDRINLSLQQDGVAQTLSTRLLVVAEGARSATRTLLGIGAQRQEYGQTALAVNVEPGFTHGNIAYERFLRDGSVLALLPLTQNRYGMVWTLPAAQAQAMFERDESELLKAIEQAMAHRRGRFLRAGRRQLWPLAVETVPTQIMPRAVLLGNTAHTLHPVAAQGFNLCLRDVAVLAEKIVAQHQQQADIGALSLLEAYERERVPDQQRTLMLSDALVRVFGVQSTALSHARSLGLLALDMAGPLKHLFARHAMGLAQRGSR